MVNIQLYTMFLLLLHHTLSHRIFTRMRDLDDPYDLDRSYKLKMLRLLKYANKLNHEKERNRWDELEYGSFIRPVQKKREKFRFPFRRRNIPISLDYELISEPIKRNGIVVGNRLKDSTYYDLDEYDEINDVDYDDADYQRLKNYIQRDSEDKKFCKICKCKPPCLHTDDISRNLQNYKDIAKFSHKSHPLKGDLLYDYIGDDESPKIEYPHNKHKHKGFQLFMLNDDDEFTSSMAMDDIRPTRTTPSPQPDFEQYEVDNDADENNLLIKNQKTNQYESNNKQRRNDIKTKILNIGINDAGGSGSKQIDHIISKSIKVADYSEFETTEHEKEGEIHSPFQNSHNFGKLTTKAINDKSDIALELSDVEVDGEKSNYESSNPHNAYNELKLTKNRITTTSAPSAKKEELDDYDSINTGKVDKSNKFLGCKNYIPTYDDDNTEYIKKSKKLKMHECRPPHKPPGDFDNEILSSSPYGKSYEKDENPCGTELNPSAKKSHYNTDFIKSNYDDHSFSQRFQENIQKTTRPFGKNHLNINRYTSKSFSNDKNHPYKHNDDGLKPDYNIDSINNHKPAETIPEWSSPGRPDGFVDDISSYDNDKVQDTPIKGGEDALLSHLKSHKEVRESSESTSNAMFSDYDSEESTKTSSNTKENSKKRQNIPDDEEEAFMNEAVLTKLEKLKNIDSFAGDDVASTVEISDVKDNDNKHSRYEKEFSGDTKDQYKRNKDSTMKKKHHRRQARSSPAPANTKESVKCTA